MDNRVLAVRCEEYNREAVREIVTQGMKALGFRPAGRIFAKPNVVFAYKPEPYGHHAYTDPAVLGGSLLATASSEGVERIDVGENAAVGMPTRMVYRYAGYYDEVRRVRELCGRPIDIFAIDEELRDTVFVGGKVHDNLRIARKMARADAMIYLPKLKCHCVSSMTGAVKLNIGICSDDERSIRHDFLLNEKIVDLLAVGWPDFIVMDAIEVGVGNEAVPSPRKLGLLLMGTNPVAVDVVAARLLGYGVDDVPYLRAAVNRGYGPGAIEDIRLEGDLTSVEAVDEQAKRILPYDAQYVQWQDVEKELVRLNSPMRLFWGPYGKTGAGEKCLTGCIMGLKMFLGFFEKYAGPEAFARAKPVTFVVGRQDAVVDGRGHEVFLIGSCAAATVVNASKVTRMDKCFTTAGDMMQTISPRLGMPSPFLDPKFMVVYLGALLRSALRKVLSLRYLQDIGYFLKKTLVRKL